MAAHSASAGGGAVTGPVAVGVTVLVSSVLLGVAACVWAAAPRGRHRATRPQSSPAAAQALADALDQLGANLPPLSPPAGPSPDAGLAALVAGGRADSLDYAHCPREKRIRPHAVHTDGSRRCWECGHHSTGDES